MKQPTRGTTGLTQKEAIFQIIKRVAGDLYQPGVSMKPLLWEQTDHCYGRARSVSCPFDKIVREVYQGRRSGAIPSKLSSDYDREGYASRIVHYWLKHDKRLNGEQVATRMANDKKKHIVLFDRVKTDPMMNSLRELLKSLTTTEDRQEVQQYISSRIFEIILETFSISPKAIPQVILDEMGLVRV